MNNKTLPSQARPALLWLLLSLLLVSTFGLAGCSGAPPRTAASDPLSQAQELEARGDFVRAAGVYLALARDADGPLRQDYQLSAAAAWFNAGEFDQARALLDSIEAEGLNKDLLIRRQLLGARLALSDGNPQQALVALEGIIPAEHSFLAQADLHLLRAEAHILLGNSLEAARARILRDALLSEPIAIRDNQLAILQALGQLQNTALQEAEPPDNLSGWMELVLITRMSAGEPGQFNERITDWRYRYRQHPASEELIASLLDDPRQLLTPSQASEPVGSVGQIALLLPLSGPLANVGAAVREGFMAAAGEQPDGTQSIRAYDVSVLGPEGDPDSILQSYQQAVQEGADLIVGPLQKEGVNALFFSDQLPVPTLALNYSDQGDFPPANLYQFGLLPEDEARQVAERAWLNGDTRALALVPEGEWGARVLAAFNKELERLGGILVDYESYSSEQAEFSAPVRALLQYTGGNPPRRQDADYLFLAAFPAQARGIGPQLQYFYASNLPVYATSHLYDTLGNTTVDLDLNGMIFADMPWVLSDDIPQQALRRELASQSPNSFQQLKRLYALGVDAYDTIFHLDRLKSSPAERFEGATGSLSLDEANRIHRRLIWARFENGQARLLAPADASLSPSELNE